MQVAYSDWMLDDHQLDEQYLLTNGGVARQMTVTSCQFLPSLQRWMGHYVTVELATRDQVPPDEYAYWCSPGFMVTCILILS